MAVLVIVDLVRKIMKNRGHVLKTNWILEQMTPPPICLNVVWKIGGGGGGGSVFWELTVWQLGIPIGTLHRRACWPLRYQNCNSRYAKLHQQDYIIGIMEITVLELPWRYTLKSSIFLCSYMVCCCLRNKLTSRTLAVPVSFKFKIRESTAVVRTKLVVLRSCGNMEVCVGSVITTSWSTRLVAAPTSIVPPEINSEVCKTKQYHTWLQYQPTMEKHKKNYFWQHRRSTAMIWYCSHS